MFLGTHLPRLDEKGRLFLPARFRDELAGGVVLTKGQERCLFLFATPDFLRLAEQIPHAPVTGKAARDYQRTFFASAFDQIPDKQGRITVPPALRDYAGLQRDCAVVGLNSRLEIWDAAAWQAYEAERDRGYAEQEEEAVSTLT